jgi:FtsP/CotA-like multicopper oxidase with cupredoxin domain
MDVNWPAVSPHFSRRRFGGSQKGEWMDSANELNEARRRTRREFLRALLALVSVLAAAVLTKAVRRLRRRTVADCAACPPEPKSPHNRPVAGSPFVPVAEFASCIGKLDVNITVSVAWRDVAVFAEAGYRCDPRKLRYYEGTDLNSGKKWPANPRMPGPGPTLRARVGDDVSIHLLNDIDPACFAQTTQDDHACDTKESILPDGTTKPLYPGADAPPSCFHGDNITNLHYHGTHVSPDGHADNVMIDVVPQCQELSAKQEDYNRHLESLNFPPAYYGGRFDSSFKITPPPKPPDPQERPDRSKPFHMGQAPGTHWYHAHKHGSVALQLMNGMAGAFIIEGEFDDQLEKLIPGLRCTEKVLVIQQLGDGPDIVFCSPPNGPLDTGITGNPVPLVNGQVEPTIQMQPGEIQRWRIINATMHQTASLRYGFTLKSPASGYVPEIRQIAYDGVQLAPERYGDRAFGQSQQFELAPGNRVDILVQAPSAVGPGKTGVRGA